MFPGPGGAPRRRPRGGDGVGADAPGSLSLAEPTLPAACCVLGRWPWAPALPVDETEVPALAGLAFSWEDGGTGTRQPQVNLLESDGCYEGNSKQVGREEVHETQGEGHPEEGGA